MSSRQFTILLCLVIVVFSGVLYLILRPSSHSMNGCRSDKYGRTEDDIASGRIIVIVKKDMLSNGGQGSPDTNAFVEYIPSQGSSSVHVTLNDGMTIFEGVSPGPYLIRATSGIFQRQFVGFLNLDSMQIKTDTVKF